METRRSLIYIPVLHSPGDMGSFATSHPPSDEYREQVAEYWRQVDAELRGSDSSWQGVRLYQDGLPNTRPDIVDRIVADVDSPNYELVRWLIAQGATIVGTEDPVLLQEEYELLKASLTGEGVRRDYADRAAELLSRRDRYIADRIGATLPDGGTGVLFIGLQHQVNRVLPGDIAVTSPRCCRDLLPAIAARLGR